MVERADGVFGDQIKLLIKIRFAKARIAGVCLRIQEAANNEKTFGLRQCMQQVMRGIMAFRVSKQSR